MISVDIGCGSNKHPEAKYGIDCMSLPGVDYVCDLESEPLPFSDNSVDVVYSRHSLEHIQNLEHILREIVRVSKPGAIVHVVVPHFSNTLGYSDYTHKRFFGYYTFDYFSRDKYKRWKVPTYNTDICFSILQKQLRFQNFSVLAPLLQWIFNGGQFLSYLYESKLAWLLPCFEIYFKLEVKKMPDMPHNDRMHVS